MKPETYLIRKRVVEELGGVVLEEAFNMTKARFFEARLEAMEVHGIVISVIEKEEVELVVETAVDIKRPELLKKYAMFSNQRLAEAGLGHDYSFSKEKGSNRAGKIEKEIKERKALREAAGRKF